MTKLLAYFNDPAVKATFAARVAAHEKADEIEKGFYWEKGRGCAVGCTIHGSSHAAYEKELGVPIMLARLEDRIFEGLPLADAKLFPRRFIEAIPVGADLSLVGWKFLSWVVETALERHGNDPVRAGCKDAVAILRAKAAGKRVTTAKVEAAWSAARKARQNAAAAYAAAAAAYAAAAAAAAYAAYAAAYAADAAAYAAARQSFYKEEAEKLLELLAAAPVPSAIAA